jgi:hypothetical protein
MTKILALLPLALTMNLGPQIITAIVVLTGRKPVRKSLIYLTGIAVAIAVVGFAAFLVFGYVNEGGTSSGQSTASSTLDYVFAGLLAVLGVWVFTQRKKAHKPKWMASIQDASSKRIFTMGLLLYSFFPSDFVVLLTAGQYLAKHKMNYYSIFPFFALTLLIAAIPLLSFLLFKKRAERVMPRIQTWLDSHGWVINEVVIVFFIAMLLFD